MSKTFVIGDLHLKQKSVLPEYEKAAEKHGVSRLVFLGDYADEWFASAEELRDNLAYQGEWCRAMRSKGYEVVNLVGNHDWQYLAGTWCSGTNRSMYAIVRELLEPLDLEAAAIEGPWLLTHAGVTNEYAERFLEGTTDKESMAARLNEMFARLDPALAESGPSRGGSGTPGPLWADMRDLLNDPVRDIDQIVGHTPVKRCGEAEVETEAGSVKLWFCDSLSTHRDRTPIGDGSILLLEEDYDVRPVKIFD